MGEGSVGNAGQRHRRARRWRRNRRGVVSVVGTLLALLVFFALFGIFLTQYVPLWMTDNESQFTSQAAASFASFQSNVNLQYILGGPATYGVSFTISSQGVPLLAQPTQGTLVFLPTTCPGGFYAKGQTGATAANYGQPVSPNYCVFQNVTLTTGPGGSGLYSQHLASGVLQMVLPNRYYTPQTFYFEDDAVIQTQPGGYQIMDFPPPLNVTSVGGNTSVTTSLLQLYGNASTVIGQGSQQVFSHLRYAQTVTSSGSDAVPLNFTFEIGTQNPCAWSRYLVSVMNVSGLPYSTSRLPGTAPYYNFLDPVNGTTTIVPSQSPTCFNPNGRTTVLAVNLYELSYATVFNAGVQVTLGIGGT